MGVELARPHDGAATRMGYGVPGTRYTHPSTQLMETRMRPIATFRTLLLATLLAQLPGATPARAETGGQFAVAGVNAPRDPDVNGVRFSLFYGKNRNMAGLDLGLVSVSQSTNLSGLALILGVNVLDGDMDGGASISLINFHKGRDTGLNAAFINKTNHNDNGLDFGFVNVADGNTTAVVGGLNLAKSSTAQIGFVNVTEEIRGVQIGFINVAKNGFLPVFPIFNFPKP